MIPLAAQPKGSGKTQKLHPPQFALPSLHFSQLFPLLKPESVPFPLADPRTEYFYFGRNAVWHAIRRLGLSGRKILVPAYHHGVEVEALVDAGAIPVFYGVDRSFKPDLAQIDQLARAGADGLYVIHFLGLPQPMDDLLTLARAHALKVIEACALALFSHANLRPLGARGDAAIFCFYKTLPVPNGGALWMSGKYPPLRLKRPPMLAVANQSIASLMRAFELRGGPIRAAFRQRLRKLVSLANSTVEVDRVPVGTRHFDPDRLNLNMSSLSLRVARGLDYRKIVEQRRRNYYALLLRLRDLSPPLVHELPSGACPLFYPLWCDDKQQLQRRLAEAGVEAIDFWREGSPLVKKGAFPEVEAMRTHILELPIHQDLGGPDMERLAKVVKEAWG